VTPAIRESTLPLLMARIAADDPNDAFAPHNFAVFAKFLY
jgi:hypothetical protein